MHRRIVTPPIKMDEDFVPETVEADGSAPDLVHEVEVHPEPDKSPLEVVKPELDEGSPTGKERRSGDRRKAQDPNYTGPERRKGDRRSMDRLRNDLHWQLAPEVENKILRGMGFKGSARSKFKPARLVLLAVALFAGGLAAFLVTQRAPQPVAEQPMIEEAAPVVEILPQILVAKQTISTGQRISADQVQWQDWPTDLVRDDFITIENSPEAIAELDGTLTRFEFFAGEPIREQKLARGVGGYLSAVINQGMRGVSVSVDGQAASGGFIVPNDRVDVVLTREAPQGLISETVLRNVRVLAINARVGELGDTGVQAGREELQAEMLDDNVIATLELDPAEAEIIVGATSRGTFALVLRSMADFKQNKSAMRSGINQNIRLTSPFWNPPKDGSALY